MLNGATTTPGEQGGQGDSGATRAVACIDLRWAAAGARRHHGDTSVVPDFALGQIQKAVRAGDRVCPMATSRLVVEFAPLASEAPPQVLGNRLARAVGTSLSLDCPVTDLTVSVGMAAPEPHRGAADLSRRAMSSARTGSSHLSPKPAVGSRQASTIVTVDRLLTPGATPPSSGRAFLSIHRRSVYRYAAGPIHGIAPAEPSSRADLPLGLVGGTSDLTVVIADPMAAATGHPGLAAQTAASMAEGLGCRVTTTAVSGDEGLTPSVDGVAADLVVLVLEGGWTGHSSTWSSSAWSIPARLTTAFLAAGIPVVAVSAGAGAGALASCAAEGALALFNLDQLPAVLQSLHDDAEQVWDVPLPGRFLALVGLTTSERRVLFYLTEGWAAQEIADRLVVSLTTVRSHIRSILRKLGVRSQLAAVAIANSRDLEHQLSGQAS